MAGTKRAVLIGINEYQDPRIPKLKGALNDALEFSDRLKESGDFEIPDEHLLLDKAATCHNIRKAISHLLWKPDPCDLTLLYFSGHGLQDSAGNGYIAPVDIEADEPLVSGIRMQELRELVLAAQNKESIVVVLDCCYSGIATEGKGDAELALEDVRLDQCFSSFGDQETGRGKVILASSGKDEKSHEVCRGHELGKAEAHDHGLFTFHLLEGLDGRASETEDVTLDALHRYLDSQVRSDHQHKITFFGAGLSQADRIVIARASQRWTLLEKLKRAAEYLKRDRPSAVFKAAKIVGEVLDCKPKYRDALDLEIKIDVQLGDYQGALNAWWVKNGIDVLCDCDLETTGFLQSKLSCLSVEVIRGASQTRRTLLYSLCDAGLRRLDLDNDEAGARALQTVVRNAVSDSQAPSSDQPLSGGNRTD